MSFFSRFLSREKPNRVMQPLYTAIVAEGRRPQWYEKGAVPDTLDGRFDMIAAILAVVLMRLDHDGKRQEYAWLTEIFVQDMDGQLRQIGVGDMVVGKHIKNMMKALGGRLAAYGEALRGEGDLGEALVRNLYRGEKPEQKALDMMTTAVRHFHDRTMQAGINDILAGKLPEAAR